MIKLKSIIESNVNNVFYHATYLPFLKSIKTHGLNSKYGKYSWEDSIKGYTYLSKDPDVAVSYAEENDNVPDSYIDKIILLKIDGNKLNRDLLFKDSNVRGDETEPSTFEYRDIIPYEFIIGIEKNNF